MRTVIDVRPVNDHFPGIGRYAYQLVRALALRKNRDELLLLANPGPADPRFPVAALASEPRVRIVSTAARPFTLREQLLLPGELRGVNPSVTHFPYAVMPFAAPRPFVVTIHDIIPVRLPQFFPLRRRILYRASLSLALRAAAAVICVSEATLSDLKSAFRVAPSRVFVIHEGVDESFRPCPDEEVERVRASRELPREYVLYVGTNKPHKNLPALIDAWSRLDSAPTLLIAGREDPRYDQTRRRVDRLNLRNRVRFLGAAREDELPALYSGARAFVFPSLYEGFGLPPLEAMACGAPVACSYIPSLRETLGDAALFFDPNDRDSMAAALHRIITDETLRAELQARGKRRAEGLSWDAAAQRTLEAYEFAQRFR